MLAHWAAPTHDDDCGLGGIGSRAVVVRCPGHAANEAAGIDGYRPGGIKVRATVAPSHAGQDDAQPVSDVTVGTMIVWVGFSADILVKPSKS